MDVQKRILMNAIYSDSPVNLIFVGPPGNGKTLLIECIREAFPFISLLIHSHTSSGTGSIESIIAMGKRLRFLLVDEIEKFSKRDRQAFLSLMEGGKISRRLANRNIFIEGFKVWFFATCNNIDKVKRDQPELINRCSIIEVSALSYEDCLYVVSKRLTREKGTEGNEEIAKYIGARVFHDFGSTDIRLAIRLARFAQAHAARTKQDSISKDRSM